VVGTSLNVYPAAGLINYVAPEVPKYVVDPKEVATSVVKVNHIREPASTGLKKITDELLLKV
jgi:NAD-dependent deacetylase